MDQIVVKGAREHNLKNIDVCLPRNKLVVITGVSGSGKSTLAFSTLYAEGQRRYVESLSSYARQFLGVMNKPDVDLIEGLSPAISIEQKSTSKNPRSTVGTTTEIYDYLRLLFARVGAAHCPSCMSAVLPQTADMITEGIMRHRGEPVRIISPVVRRRKGTYGKLFEELSRDGFSQVIVNGSLYFIDEVPPLEKNKKQTIAVLIDTFVIDDRHHVADAVGVALNLSGGYVQVTFHPEEKGEMHKTYTSHASCVDCDLFFEDLQPRNFSFNSPVGACASCAGLGEKYVFDRELVIPDPTRSIAEGCIMAFNKRLEGYRMHQLSKFAHAFGFSLLTPFEDLSQTIQQAIIYGSEQESLFEALDQLRGRRHWVEWEGVIPLLERLHQQTESEYRKKELERFMRSNPCGSCKGKRLKPEVLAVLVGGKNIIEITELAVRNALTFFKGLVLGETQQIIAQQVLKEIVSRLYFLDSVGLGYLTLARSMGTLSGGESQRIRLATQIGANLMGVMYVLDEPSIGLHQRDNQKLINTLKRLRDLGNTVIVVEHDEETILEADYVLDIGPGAGVHGGEIIAAGTPQEIMAHTDSVTGRYLAGQETIAPPGKRREGKGLIEIKGARENNLKQVSVHIPTGIFTCVTGVSGSGKSTLINQVLARQISRDLYEARERPGDHDEIVHQLKQLIVIDQSPIGRTPRSNPATYTKVFDHIRKLFAATKDAQVRGFKEGRFSFNVSGGRCEHCSGDGTIKIEMSFLPDVYVTCDECKGARYNPETLRVLYKGHTIAQVLGMNVEEALAFFKDIPPIARRLQTLFDVGLGYITLGQSALTFSGGEAQRIKLSKELSKVSHARTLYILDEPTTGLHFEDVRKFLMVVHRLVEKGASVLVIEHNLDVIACADYVIDLGPEGGDGGGRVIATGTPEQVARHADSYTGKFLAQKLRT